ncbi:methyltransferase, partial [bacterium]|nr:methyltransferase [bacterium]
MTQCTIKIGENVKILYEIDELPIFQNRMYDSKEEAINCPKGDVRLVEDLKTGLVYNECFRPELMQYDDNYQNEQAVSSQFRAHLEKVMQIIANTMGRESIVEVGCGKGFFLEMLLADGFDV